MSFRESPLVERLALWWARISAWRRRITPAGVSVRVLMFVSGAAALLLAAPEPLRFRLGIPVAVVLPLAAVARPGGAWVWAVLVTALTGWVLGTLAVARPSLTLAFGIGAAMYVHHAAAAVADAWRGDTAVKPVVWRGWAVRLGLVLSVSLVAVVATVVLAAQPLPLPPETLLVAGVIGALGIPAAFVFSLSRR
ncbi:MAG: hypothetical protein ACRD0P_02995 [Stackebrandtia sp.]